MRVFSILAFAGTLFFLLSGCAIHTGTPLNSTGLDEANFRYVARDLAGTASTLRVFGIGGLKRDAIVREAKAAMLEGRELQDNQALANLTVNFKWSFYILVSTTDCTVTADIVEFTEED